MGGGDPSCGVSVWTGYMGGWSVAAFRYLPLTFWGVSLGSGVSVGNAPGRVIIDAAYSYTGGDDVLGTLVPDQEGLETDVVRHQAYLSGIVHF